MVGWVAGRHLQINDKKKIAAEYCQMKQLTYVLF